MRGMILAAGLGQRMGQLTQTLPKPLLKVGGRYLIEYSLMSLVKAGIHEIAINVFYHADKIKTALGDGSRYGARIVYSEEKERLETGGGIFKMLPWLGDKPFIVISSDLITEYPLANLPKEPTSFAHLLMVNNPLYHPKGDFGLSKGVLTTEPPTLTFANVGIYRPELFADASLKPFRLAEVLLPAVAAGKVTGEHYQGAWLNVGTPEDLVEANRHIDPGMDFPPLTPEVV